MYLDEILDEKYEVYLQEADYTWNEYDDWTDNKPKLLMTFKTMDEAKAYLAICEAQKEETQKKYRGKISYYIRPQYLRHHVTAVWVDTKKTQKELDDALSWLYKPKDPKVYTG